MSKEIFLSVTPNPALDKILKIDSWQRGELIIALEKVTSVGGKGLDASVALRHLGQPTVGLHFAAGSTGHELLHKVNDYGIIPDVIWVGGETRTATIISESNPATHTHIFSGDLSISNAQVEELFSRYKNHLNDACWVITGGKLPPGIDTSFFGSLVETANVAGVPILIDSFGKPLEICLEKGPTVVKMNIREFNQTFSYGNNQSDEFISNAKKVYEQQKLQSLIVTCGEAGIFAFTEDGVFHASAPVQNVVNAVGAGDAASAAIAWKLSQGEKWLEVLRWAAAVSAASVLTQGTSDFQMKEVLQILPEVKIKVLGSVINR
jgi:1-phosphofructokinase family hexose kinase